MRIPYQPGHGVSELEKAIERVRLEFDPGHFATVEAALLRPSDLSEVRAGTKPLYGMMDQAQRRYALKLGRLELMAAEQAAYELRHLGRRPCLPARVVDVELEGLGPVQGLLKPFVEFDPKRELSPDTRTWSELQRSVVLLEHAWEWLLDNSDTNTSQYALIGEQGYPLNIDWDRSFATGARSELSRFEKYKVVLPNARTFLYSDYVEGKIDLPFSVLHAEARRIRLLPVTRVREIVEGYARVCFADAAERAAFVSRVLRRQRHIEADFKRFARDLLRERVAVSVAPQADVQSRLRQGMTLLWDRSQVPLHWIARGPVGTTGRKLLRFARRRLWFNLAQRSS
ncbi:MAG TPA: hypothetical protein VM686_24140 [Polyangiaceae bacterium]|jgi:hypothetical protein|nr:hypothetical protein [Polyangiaceae bacterium]